MTAVKHVPSVGVVPAATSIPALLCQHISADETKRCYLAPHAQSTACNGYDQVADATVSWRHA